MAEALGFKSAREVWCALEAAYSHDSVERMHTLRDSLRHLQKGNSSVADYNRKFKSICDQLAAIGHPVDDTDKIHWFLCGLGSPFETFSTTQRAIKSRPSFRDLLSEAENHELFLNSVHGPSPPHAAFSAYNTRGSFNTRGSSNTHGRGRSSNRGGFSGGRGRRPPHCQLCRKEGHFANNCPDLASFAQRTPSLDANLAQAFHAQCHVTDNSPDWFVDSGASAHMTSSVTNLDSATPYSGKDQVIFGNGKVLDISHVGTSSLSKDIDLLNVLSHILPKIYFLLANSHQILLLTFCFLTKCLLFRTGAQRIF